MSDERTSRAVEARSAATVVLTRAGRTGLEVLLGRRPASMAFAPDVHVFPGGAVDSADSQPALIRRSTRTPADAAIAMGGDLEPVAAIAAHVAAIRELFEEAGVLLADIPATARRSLGAARAALVGGEIAFADLVEQLDLTLRTDRLVPISRWVTPPTYPRRFDARFFAAELPAGATASIHGDEVVAHAWLRPARALDAMASGDLALWPPTSATLQELEHAGGFDAVRAHLASGRLGTVAVDEPAPGIVRIQMPAGGGIAGQPVHAYLVGRRSFVLVDPGDPTGPALERAIHEAGERGGTIVAIALTHVDADHAAGAEVLAVQLEIPIVTGPGGGRPLPFEVREVADGTSIEDGDIPLHVVATPGLRPDHVAMVVGDDIAVLTGDLDGRRGARSIVGPVDETALAASRERAARLSQGSPRLGGHPGTN